jgi:hypothetical protein
VEVDDRLNWPVCCDSIECLGLDNGSRKTVENVPTGSGIVLFESLANDLNHDVVTDESTGFDDLLGCSADFGTLTDSCSQDVTGGDVWDHVVTRYAQTLSALPRPLAAHDDQPNAGHE